MGGAAAAGEARAASGTPAAERGRRLLGWRRWRRLLGWRRWRRRCVRLALGSALAAVALFAACWFAFPFPLERLRRWPASPVVRDRAGRVLLAAVGSDDQWRLPVRLADVSPWLVLATLAAEDERFHAHPGVDPLAVARAAGQNVLHGRVVSGASTITMQLCKMLDPKPRTLWNKAVEAFRALQLEQLLDKEEILELYLDVAPYGGNLRGVEAAARFYLGKGALELTLGEAALIAGLPQSPTRLRPDRHLERALERRRWILDRLVELEFIDDGQRARAAAEPFQLATAEQRAAARPPGAGRQVAWLALAQRPAGGTTSIDLALQEQVEARVARWSGTLPAGSDVAVVVVDIDAAAVRALVGSSDPSDPVDGQVNGATARRSPGSALKPFIYAAAFETGRLGPGSAVDDVPVTLGHWRPQNFDRTFRGRMTVADALRASRNVPALRVARAVGLARVHGLLRALGFSLDEGALRRAGLGLATGGVEVSLLELTDAYAALGRGGLYRRATLWADREGPRERPEVAGSAGDSEGTGDRGAAVQAVGARRVLTATVCAHIDAILSSGARRPRGTEELAPAQLPWFVWKTGTSSRRRDAWAVGHDGRHAIGVWVGRFGGAGDVRFVGAQTAEPLLAELFAMPPIARGARTVADAPVTPPPIPLHHEYDLSAAVRALRIAEPSDGATYRARDGAVTMALRAEGSGATARDLRWFLDGAVVRLDAGGTLRVAAGRHRLTCVTAAGKSARVEFAVVE